MTLDTSPNFGDGNDADPQGVSVSFEKVTPALAAEWLELNTDNRAIRNPLVTAYARDMTARNWHMAGEGIKFGRSGKLLDGQHRLWAIIESGVTVELLVIRGLGEDSQRVMDTGAARTAADALRLRDEKNATLLAGAAKVAIHYLGGRRSAAAKVTHSEIETFISDNPSIRDAVGLASSWRDIDVPPSTLAVAVWRIYDLSPDACVAFFTQLSNMTGLSAGDPILALKKALDKIRRQKERRSAGDFLSLIFRAWNAYRDGKSLTQMAVTTWTGAVDIPEPR